MKRYILICIAVLMLIAVPACQASSPYDGTWKSTGNLDFVAKINHGEIKITWNVDDETSGLYWKGTLPSFKNAKAISVADTDALDASLLGSLDNTKKFTLSHGKIRFQFSAVGSTSTIYLARQ